MTCIHDLTMYWYIFTPKRLLLIKYIITKSWNTRHNKHCLQTATFQHAFKSYTRKFVTMDTGMLQVNKFLDFRLSFPQTSLIVHRETFSSRQNNRISVIWKEAESKLFYIQKKTTIPNSKALVNKLMPHCLQKRTKLTLPIVFEQIKMPSLSNNVLFYYL